MPWKIMLWMVAGLILKVDCKVCSMGQEPDSTGVFKWVLFEDDPMECKQIWPGGLNIRPPANLEGRLYFDEPFFSLNFTEIKEYITKVVEGIVCNSTLIASSFANGTVSCNGTAFGAACTYTCTTGYSFDTSGNKSVRRSCMQSGEWSGQKPVCRIVTCDATEITAPTNGTVSPIDQRYVFGDVATFTCDTGYFLDGDDPTRKCQGNGSWSGTSHSCSTCYIATQGDNYHFNTPILTSGRIEFEAKAARGLNIALSKDKNEDEMYEIVIGGLNNMESKIRSYKHQNPAEVTMMIPNILDPLNFQKYFITVNETGTIRVGKGCNLTNYFMEWTDPNPRELNSFGFSSYGQHTGEVNICSKCN